MAYSNKMIKEDHLLACTTRMSEISNRRVHNRSQKPCCDHTFWILPGPLQYTETSEPTSSRLPTIHLSKNLANTAANQSRFVVVNPIPGHPARFGEADDIVTPPAVNRVS